MAPSLLTRNMASYLTVKHYDNISDKVSISHDVHTWYEI